VSYKANRLRIGDIAQRQAYLEENPRCEICGSSFLLAVHHHIPQQYAINGQVFILDIPQNYTALCGLCHGEKDKEMNKLKDGSKPEEHVLAWIEQQPRDWFYVTVLEKIEQIIKEQNK
jgi:hypothetical protein